MTERGGPLSFCRILAPTNAPHPTNQKYFTILMTEMRDAINFVGFWRPPPQCPPPLTPQYLTILMTVRGGATIFCRILPPPPPDAAILNYLSDREGGGGAPLSFCRILTPSNAPPPTIPKYFTILMTEMRDCYFCRILAPPNAPPSPDAKILNYLTDREGAGITFSRILAPPNAPPLPRRHNT